MNAKLKIACLFIIGLIMAIMGMSMKNSKLRKKAAKSKSKLHKEIHDNKIEKLREANEITKKLISKESKKKRKNAKLLTQLVVIKKKEQRELSKLRAKSKKEQEGITKIDEALKFSETL